ncbi:uncharacterized protein RCO7_00413 [Rhynchosporium graminicola]|uniref:Uncharacterized protein n=1 Tax=Rhynchosporium graminicola TaxID=2792576 RepID=A0A1E1KLX6_9HELO|nr:uncharacterized protein RCO7_00413 [Rhynchosporium commune]
MEFLPDKLVCYRTVNCTLTDGLIDADPDIAGLGVIIAFIAASFITFSAIVLGYITHSIDAVQLNHVDRIMIPHLRWLLHMGTGNKISEKTRMLREQTMTHFILALSDQQLVTGLAVLITGYAQLCSISGHHFEIVASLAWFSSTTHLSTLTVLQKYLISHPMIKHMRVVGVMAVLGPLFHAQLYMQWGDFDSLLSMHLWIHVFRILGERVLTPLCRGLSFLDFHSHVTSIRTLLEDGVRRGLNLPPSKTPEQLYTTTLKRLESMGDTGNQQRHSCWSSINISLARKQYVLSMFMNSFWWQIIWMLFGNLFGFLQLWRARFGASYDPVDQGSYRFEIRGSENDWGFGQIVAILLMILPLLAAVEAYSDLKTSMGYGDRLSIDHRPSQIIHDSNINPTHSLTYPSNITPLEFQETIFITAIWVLFSAVWGILGLVLYAAGWQANSNVSAQVAVVCVTAGVITLTLLHLGTYSGDFIRDVIAKRRERCQTIPVATPEDLQLDTRGEEPERTATFSA